MHAGDDREKRALTPAAEDKRYEHLVLDHVLHEHPDQLTLAELLCELAKGEPDPAEADAIRNAVRDLVAAGLLHREGEAIRPSRAALCFHRLVLD